MNTTLKIYDKIRALAGSWEIYHNGIKWNTVFRNGEIIRGRIEVGYEDMYFTIESLEDNNVIDITISSFVSFFEYSLDNGDTWLTSDTSSLVKSITLNNGDKLIVAASGETITSIKSNDSKQAKVYGNIMSLIWAHDFIGKVELGVTSDHLYGLFKNFKGLVDASNLILPATTLGGNNLSNGYFEMFYGCTSLLYAPKILPALTLTTNCYERMFYGCTSLVTTPSLPATTLGARSYAEMFRGCTSLVNAPEICATTLAYGYSGTELYYGCCSAMFYGCTSLVTAPSTLPATTLTELCYEAMFYGCTSLVTAPSLPATTLAKDCYRSMFYGCTSLVNAPTLQVTTLEEGCYNGMFYKCTSLVTAPTLPATTLVKSCYAIMFNGCTSLKSITCYATTRSATYCLDSWVSGVSATGDFYKRDMSWTSTGDSQIPAGWTQHNI